MVSNMYIIFCGPGTFLGKAIMLLTSYNVLMLRNFQKFICTRCFCESRQYACLGHDVKLASDHLTKIT